MRFDLRKAVFSAMALGAVLICTIGDIAAPSRALADDEADSGFTAVNPFHGTYTGGYWSNNIPGVGPYGGDVKATITTAGKVSITLPGAGTGTVSTSGVYSVTGKLKVKNVLVNVTYTGKLVATKHPTTGAYLAVVGSGTWKTTSGVSSSGKWLVQRTSTTP